MVLFQEQDARCKMALKVIVSKFERQKHVHSIKIED